MINSKNNIAPISPPQKKHTQVKRPQVLCLLALRLGFFEICRCNVPRELPDGNGNASLTDVVDFSAGEKRLPNKLPVKIQWIRNQIIRNFAKKICLNWVAKHWYLEVLLHYLVVSNIFSFHPYLGKIPNLTHVFQMGWNHQPVDIDEYWIWQTFCCSTIWYKKWFEVLPSKPKIW